MAPTSPNHPFHVHFHRLNPSFKLSSDSPSPYPLTLPGVLRRTRNPTPSAKPVRLEPMSTAMADASAKISERCMCDWVPCPPPTHSTGRILYLVAYVQCHGAHGHRKPPSTYNPRTMRRLIQPPLTQGFRGSPDPPPPSVQSDLLRGHHLHDNIPCASNRKYHLAYLLHF